MRDEQSKKVTDTRQNKTDGRFVLLLWGWSNRSLERENWDVVPVQKEGEATFMRRK